MEKYIRWLKRNNYSFNTIRTYRSVLGIYKNLMHDIRLVKKKIVSYSDSPNTCILHYNVITQYLKWTKDSRVKSIKSIKLPRIPMIYREVFSKKYLYEKTFVHDIDDYLTAQKKVTIRFLYETGIRVSELENILTVTDDYIIIRGKGNKNRSVMYKKETYRKLSNIKKTTKTIRLWVKEILGDCYTPHSIRRSFATNMLLSGASPKMVQFQMGHSKIETTFSYLNISKEDNKKIYKKYM